MKTTLTLLLAAALMTMFVVSAFKKKFEIKAEIDEAIDFEEFEFDEGAEGKPFEIGNKQASTYYGPGYMPESAKANKAAAYFPIVKDAAADSPFEKKAAADSPFEKEAAADSLIEKEAAADSTFEAKQPQPKPEPGYVAAQVQSGVKPGKELPPSAAGNPFSE